MKKLYQLSCLFLFLIVGNAVYGQQKFQLIEGIPHLPVGDPAVITNPALGMLVYDSKSDQPLIFTGQGWESWCTTSITEKTNEDFFIVKNEIPHLPVLDQPLVNGLSQGTLYYSTVDKSVMIYNGIGWVKLSELGSTSFSTEAGFVSGKGVQTFKIPVLKDDPNTTIKGAFYINSASLSLRYFDGTGWKELGCFPVIETLAVDNITGTTAIGGGNIIDNGGSSILKMGITWSTHPLPDTTMGTKSQHFPNSPGTGEFTDTMSDLVPNTTYYVRAYAENSTRLVYGDPVKFTTGIDTPSVITLPIESITPISAESGGFISNNGGAPVTQRGIIWSINGDPLDDPNRLVSDDGDGVGSYPSTLYDLLGSTTYYVRAYAENKAGTGYGQLIAFTTLPPVAPELSSNSIRIYDIQADQALGDASLLNHGGAPILEKGIAWSLDQVNWIYGPSNTGNLTDMGIFTATLAPLSPATTYYAKGYAINKVDTAYTHVTSFITPSLVTITTNAPKDITGFTAISGGDITDIGNSRVIQKGIVWSTDSNDLDISTAIIELLPDTQMTVQSESGDGLGIYASNLTKLNPGTTYYVRAYAVNGIGVAYGNLDSLTTLDLAKVITLAPSSFFQNTAQSGGDITDDGGTEVTQRGVVWARHAMPTLNDFHTIDGNGIGLYPSILIGLTKDVTYYIRAYAINEAGIAYGEIREFKIIPGAPTIITLPIRNIKSSSAVSGGDITSAGDQNAPITRRGIRWSSVGDPIDDPNAFVSIDDTQDGDGVGEFPSTLYSLLGETTYYVRAYAENKYGLSYGNLLQFTTLPAMPPGLNSADIKITDITNTSAIGHGSVIDNGGAPVTARGIALSTDRINYTYIESHTLNPNDLGAFIVNLDNLTPATLYHAKAYAVNSVGIGYSSETSFNTTALAILTTTKAYDITGVVAWSGGHITYNGDGNIAERGLIWNTDKESLTTDLDTKASQTVNAPGLGEFKIRMTALEPGTWYYYRAYAVNFYGTAYGNTDSLFTATTASIITTTPSLITNSTVRTGGTILDDGGEPISSRGVVWGISDDLTSADEHTVNGSGKGAFTSDLSELLGSTTYYVRAYARNSVGVAYGDAKSFTTNPAGIPIVRTTSAINIAGTTAVGRGNVTSHGGSSVTERGIVWNTTGNPMVGIDEKVTAGEGSGSFSGTLTGLTPVTKYYFRAYAINEVGTAYGEDLVFTTFTTATIITSDVSSITATTATGGGDIISDGGPQVIQSGIVWSHVHPLPVYSRYGNYSDTWQTTGGAGIGNFIHQMNGLLGNTTYYVRAYAENSAGVSYGEVKIFRTAPPVLATLTTNASSSRPNGLSGNSGGRIISNGGALIEQVGVVWSTSSGFNVDTVFNNRYTTGGTGNFTVVVPNLKVGTTYYIRALAMTSVGTAYGNEISFTTFSRPEVITKDIYPASVTPVSANGGGEITKDGGTGITGSGLVWSTEQKPTLDKDEHTSNGAGKGEFINTISELLGNTTYYVRAYATNSVGTSYGEEVSFTTQPPVLATLITHSPTIVSATAAKGGGNIVSNGGAVVTTRGLIWLSEIEWQGEGSFHLDQVPQANKTAETGYFKGNYTHSIPNLTENTVYYVRAYVVNSVGVSYGQVVDFKTPRLPQLTTMAATAIASSMAITGGDITDEGGAPVTARGVVYSIHPNFNPDTVTFFRTANGGGEGVFDSPLTRLKGSTTYYVRAYARNIAGINYGNQIGFETAPPKIPTLTTRNVSSISGTTATGGGTIMDDGGDDLISRGLVWSTQQGFDYKNVPSTNKTVHMGGSIGAFTSGMNDLKPGTIYYVRAYATNDAAGTGYGNEVSFTTLIVPSLKTTPASPLTGGTNTKSGGTIQSDGGNPIRNQGAIWSTVNDPSVITTSLSTKTAYDELVGDDFSSTLTKLLPVTTYYVRAYATNNQGAGYGDILSFITPVIVPKLTTNIITPISMSSATTGGTISSDGGAAITKRGVVWSADINFNPDTVTINRTENGAGTGGFSSNVINLELSTTYYVRAYATNSAGTGYGNQVAVTIFPTSPRLETRVITNIGGYTAVSGGKITSDGGAPITQKGIVWSTEPNPTVRDSRTINGSGTDDFISSMSNLLPNTKYYVRAYAVNMIGTAYGIEEEFLTNGLPVLTVTKAVTDIIATTASSGGEVTDDGRTPILARGITWSIYGNPTVSLSTKTVENITAPNDGLGSFTAKMTGMKPETNYYVRSYATNSVGTEYGAQISFKTLEVMLPSVTTTPPSAVDSAKATSGGEVTDDGGMPVTVRGITWSKSSMPTTAEVTKTNHATGGKGIYTNIMAGLAPGTTYYVRAYAINSVGTAYGQEESLTTDAIRPTVSQVILSDLTMTTAKGLATVVQDGGAEVTDRGLTWSTTHSTPVSPTDPDSTLSNGPVGTDVDGKVIQGILSNLAPNTTYYVWAYATNKEGTRYSALAAVFTTPTLPTLITTKPSSITRNSARSGGNITSDGGVPILSRGVVWTTDSLIMPEIGLPTQTLDGVGKGAFTSQITELKEGSWYYVRAYATNAMGTNYGQIEKFRTMNVPTVETGEASSITSVSMTSGGEVIDDGGANVLARGVVWTTDPEILPTISLTTKTANGTGLGEYISQLASLKHYTDYYIRAYATNSLGAGYGKLDTVRTSPIAPTVSNVEAKTITDTSVEAKAEVISDGGDAVTKRGFVWNNTGSPILDSLSFVVEGGSDIGEFFNTIGELREGPTYYVRAFATNGIGTSYSPSVTRFKKCPAEFSVIHVAGLNGAPVDKTVVYHSVSSDYSGELMCWITQNLGAEKQAISATDNSEAAAGWYWQFNKAQGYKHDGTTRTPSTSSVYPWQTSVSQSSNWTQANDPCHLLIGLGWRMPTSTEWTRVDAAPQSWVKATDAFNSELKLHAAGYLTTAGVLAANSRGTSGYYWGTNQYNATNGYYLNLAANNSSVTYSLKANAFSMRCLRDTVVLSIPSVSNVEILNTNMTKDSALGTAAVGLDGGSKVTARGLVWNMTGDPVIGEDNVIAAGAGIGSFEGVLKSLAEGPTYYVRAFATNGIGTAYSPVVTSFKVCNDFTVIHTAGLKGSPVTKTVTYGTVSTNMSGSPMCWITQNLGADKQAALATDGTEAAAGWYWQYSRPEGYKHDGAVRTPTAGWISAYNGIGTTSWTLANDPCNLLLGSGWRLPTSAEWTNANGGVQNWTAAAHAYASVLKLHMAGQIAYTGTFSGRGTNGNYWSSTSYNSTSSYFLSLTGSSSVMSNNYKAQGMSVRCLRDAVKLDLPSVSNVIVLTENMKEDSALGSATVALDGGAKVIERGFVWSTTGTPTIDDTVILLGEGVGDMEGVLEGLIEGPTYYVRAFASNTVGTAYSPMTTSFKLCNEFTVIHTGGLNGAPVDKIVTYGVISSSISGAPRCWITQNLGADRKASYLTDASEESSGWYWQYSRPQGYKHTGTVRTPTAGWISAYNGIATTTWTLATDPCNLLLGNGWRLPTLAEWTSAVSVPPNWTTPAYTPVLNLHLAGQIAYTGTFSGRGANGNYWSSTSYNSTSSYFLSLTGGASAMSNNYKAQGMSVRCLRDAVVVNIPTVSDVSVPTASMTEGSAKGVATVSLDGGAKVIERGLVWGLSNNPTLENNVIDLGSGVGDMEGVLKDLVEGPTYYVRAFATNSEGTAYSSLTTSFKLCNEFTVIHTAGLNGAPVDKTVTYGVISSSISGAPRCWITQNLGADRGASSLTDASEESSGWYWQYSRPQGYKHTGTVRTPTAGWISAYNGIATTTWTLGTDPCNLLLGGGWRLPTLAEWTSAISVPPNWTTPAYTPVLNLHLAGQIAYTGTFSGRGANGNYWSSTSYNSTSSYFLSLIGSSSTMSNNYKSQGMSVRCLRDAVVVNIPTVSEVSVPTAKMAKDSAVGLSTVALDGGAKVIKRGLVWGLSNNPTLEDNVIDLGSGVGNMEGVLKVLVEGPTYYVRAFATNSEGTAYSPLTTSFKICNEFTVIHTAGLNGAPVDKTVTYGVISSSISGAPRCWITQNLGADNSATSVTDNSETAAGWYWQYSRPQGYKQDGAVRTPAAGWISTYNGIGTTSWTLANDPCNLLLGNGWRLPTLAEWTSAITVPPNWTTPAYTPVLNLHLAGQIAYGGAFSGRGTNGNYWSSTNYTSTSSYFLGLTGSSSTMSNNYKSQGMSVRCLKD